MSNAHSIGFPAVYFWALEFSVLEWTVASVGFRKLVSVT